MDFFSYIIKQAFKTRARHLVAQVLFFLLLIVPLGILGVMSYAKIKQELTSVVMMRRNTVAHLAATIIEERFNRIVDVGKSLAEQQRVRQAVRQGKWDEAMTYVENVTGLPFIDLVYLADAGGTVYGLAPRPSNYAAIIGGNYAYRDWYRGVSAKWEPYVSEVYKRAAVPNYNVVSVVIPIMNENNTPIGILGFTVHAESFLDWKEHIDVGYEEIVYFVDQKGKLISHPNFSFEEDIVDFSSVPVVQKVLRGTGGVEITFNPIENEERVSAYEPVHHYGWGVVAAQPVTVAFAERDASLQLIMIVYGVIIAFALFFAYCILKILHILHFSWEKEKLIFESIGDGVVIIDRAWKITHCNAVAERLTGWTKEEMIGKPFRDVIRFISENDRKENIVFIEEAFLFKQVKSMEGHTVLIGKNGKEIPVSDSAAPIAGKNGEVSGVVIVFRDASQERETQALRSDFAYASHQLRTPVNKALWSLELALSEKKQKALVENATIAYKSLQSVRKLVSDLLAASELDQGTVMPAIALVKLTDMFDEIIDGANEAAKEKEVIIAAPPISQTAAIYTDRKLTVKSIHEILDNAITHSSPKSEIKLNVMPQEDGVLVEVRDFGRGIPKNEQPLIFTKFFRGSNFDTTETAGTGLGLYISRAYIMLLGGKMWFHSEEGKGTTFSIFLPEKAKSGAEKN